MEEVKIRYKIVCADSHILFSSVDLSVRPSTVLTLKSTKRAERLEAKTEQIITKGKTNY